MERHKDPSLRSDLADDRDKFQPYPGVVVEVDNIRLDPPQQEGEVFNDVGRLREQEVVEMICREQNFVRASAERREWRPPTAMCGVARPGKEVWADSIGLLQVLE
jgi:hypothetical protein